MMMYSDEDIKDCDGVYDYIWPRRYVRKSGKKMKPLPQKPPKPKGPSYAPGFRPPRDTQVRKICDMSHRKLPAPPPIASAPKKLLHSNANLAKGKPEVPQKNKSNETQQATDAENSSGEDSEGYEDVESFMRDQRSKEPTLHQPDSHQQASRVRVLPTFIQTRRASSDDVPEHVTPPVGINTNSTKNESAKIVLPSNLKKKFPPAVKPKPDIGKAECVRVKPVPHGVVSPRLAEKTTHSKKQVKPRETSIRRVEDIPKDVSGLSVKELCECLVLMKMEKFVEAFEEYQLNGRLLIALEVDDFQKELGMTKLMATKLHLFAAGKFRPDP